MMLDKRSEVEIAAKVVLDKVSRYLTGGQIGKQEFRELLGEIRDVRYLLNNKESGCWSGMHSSACTCQPNKPGGNLQWLTYK